MKKIKHALYTWYQQSEQQRRLRIVDGYLIASIMIDVLFVLNVVGGFDTNQIEIIPGLVILTLSMVSAYFHLYLHNIVVDVTLQAEAEEAEEYATSQHKSMLNILADESINEDDGLHI